MLRHYLENQAFTENGAVSNKSTGSNLLNFFAIAGSARNKTEQEIINMFEKAYADDPAAATTLLFYFRDVRGGQGERRLFRVLMNHLAKTRVSVAKELLFLIPEYGRWDDLYLFVGTLLETEAFRLMKKQWDQDIVSEYPSLLAKWLKGTRPSSKEAHKLMYLTAEHFGLSLIAYQKTLSKTRKKLNIVESKMASGQWSEIDYSKIPSLAMKQYFRAFLKRDTARFVEYLEALTVEESGVKVNASTLVPHDIVAKILRTHRVEQEVRKLYEAQWKALPKFPLDNSISVVDVSGSMSMNKINKNLSSMDIAVSLGIYTAENLEGPFKDSFITFSSKPELEVLRGRDLVEKVYNMTGADWGMNTNFVSVFKLILDTAKRYDLPDSEIPKRILVISDMQFDQADRYNTNFEVVKKMFEDAGYTFPQLIFWNVAASIRLGEFPIKQSDRALLLSGFNPVVLKYIYKNEMAAPIDLVYEVVNAERYADVVKILEKLYL